MLKLPLQRPSFLRSEGSLPIKATILPRAFIGVAVFREAPLPFESPSNGGSRIGSPHDLQVTHGNGILGRDRKQAEAQEQKDNAEKQKSPSFRARVCHGHPPFLHGVFFELPMPA